MCAAATWKCAVPLLRLKGNALRTEGDYCSLFLPEETVCWLLLATNSSCVSKLPECRGMLCYTTLSVTISRVCKDRYRCTCRVKFCAAQHVTWIHLCMWTSQWCLGFLPLCPDAVPHACSLSGFVSFPLHRSVSWVLSRKPSRTEKRFSPSFH